MNLYELDNSKSPRKKIAEISDKVMHDYRRQAHYDVQGHKFGSKKDDPNAAAIIAKREKGMAQAGNKIVARRDAQIAQRREEENQRLRDKYAGVDIDAEMAKLKPAMDRAYHEYQYGARNTWSQGRDDYQSLSGKMAELQRAKTALGESVTEASPETTFNVLKGLKSWQVVIMNNYYRGKYSDYSGRYYYVLATSPEEAQQVVLDNADGILQELLAMKSHNGKKILPRGSALRITPERIGDIKDGTEAGRMSTAGYKKMFGPEGVMMVKLEGGAVVDVQGQEQGVTEATGNVGRDILDLIRNIKHLGHDAMEELYSSCPLLAQFWDQYEGDFRSMVIELSPKTLNRIKAEIAAFNQQGVAEGLNEFAPPGSGDNGDDGFSDDTLKRLAAQWYNGDEDPRVERILAAAGWEIGQDEGYDDEPGVFVVQAGDVNGNSFISWPAHELKQGVAEGTQTVGHEILGMLRQVRRQGDDAMEELYSSCPLLAQFWDQYEGDFRSMVVELSPKTLQRIHAEIIAVVQSEELGEGKHKCSCHPGDADPDCPVHGLEPMEVGDALDVKEGVADSLPMADAVKVLKQYGAEHFKTGSESLNFYKGGKAYKLELTWNDDTTRRVSLSELNHVVRTLKAQDNKFNFNPDDNWSQDFETRMSKGVTEVSDKTLVNYMSKVDADSQKHPADPTKRPADKASRSVTGFAKAFNKLDGRKPDGSLEEDNNGFDTHIVMVTVSDPGHQAVTQRGETKQRRCRVRADDRESAINTAINWYRKQGYRVHDHHYVGAIRSGATPQTEDTGLNELSNELLGRYKKELGVRASAADKAGDYDKGHELFKKINKATIRQGENDARKHEQENQNEIMETRLNMMRKAGYDL
jgi:hypothetical protein